MALTNAEKSKRYRDKKRKEKEAIMAGDAEPKYILNVEVSKAEFNNLTEMGVLRAGCREPYSASDYAANLLRNVMPSDRAQYEEQIKDLGTCTYCKGKLPKGCNGVFRGEATTKCYHYQESLDLELCRVTLSL